MSLINYNSKEINCKIIYFGPPSSGKTTNLQQIFKATSPEGRGQLISFDGNQPTLFYDFLPLAAGSLRGFQVRFHLYTVPDFNKLDHSRQQILRGVDGIVFVLDCSVARMEANLESYSTLAKNLEEQGYEIDKVPLVFQYNKRDLANISPILSIAKVLDPMGLRQGIPAVASKGEGVLETLNALSKLVLQSLKGQA